MTAARAKPLALTGRVAVVTGTARGIGLNIAQHLAAAGARVVIGDMDGRGLEQSVSALQKQGAEVVGHAGDLSRQEEAIALRDAAIAAFGTIDILVNNAGGGVILPFLSHTSETLRQTVDRNLWTTLWCCHAILPVMKAKGYGRIVNVGADSVRSGLWDHAAYNAAKGGMHGLTSGLAREFAKDGITVNTVAPCAVNTPQLSEILAKDPNLVDQFVSIVPMGRPAEMDEVSAMIAFLASSEASFVTGQVISVNGGSTML
ncbi:SDR family oxidoreductase [Magnetospirillum sp. 15-1]|uniref:SDR family NAD(P)-dependent oxidoreductase n=1 Tax=Magnetospirillum sp. 15-1 TaxID=1979370 RepID=UPI0014839904|nr:SDR family oxidoreductase [Magnetospirillum sp. 15-1]